MSAAEALAWVRDTSDEDADASTIREAFEAIFGREPDEDDGDSGTLWSHCCAALSAEERA